MEKAQTTEKPERGDDSEQTMTVRKILPMSIAAERNQKLACKCQSVDDGGMTTRSGLETATPQVMHPFTAQRPRGDSGVDAVSALS